MGGGRALPALWEGSFFVGQLGEVPRYRAFTVLSLPRAKKEPKKARQGRKARAAAPVLPWTHPSPGDNLVSNCVMTGVKVPALWSRQGGPALYPWVTRARVLRRLTPLGRGIGIVAPLACRMSRRCRAALCVRTVPYAFLCHWRRRIARSQPPPGAGTRNARLTLRSPHGTGRTNTGPLRSVKHHAQRT